MDRRGFLKGTAAGAAALAAPSIVSAYTVAPRFQPQVVTVRPGWNAGDIHVDPYIHHLYFILPGNQAIRYGVAVGSADQYASGTFRIGRKAEWPSWTPTANMIRREPEKYAKYKNGLPGGPDNPLGARALYLYRGSRDSMLRIHGTPQPWSIGQSVSSGCVRMVNEHVMDLYARAPRGTRVVLH